MIEVTCNETGDWAEAPCPESAVVCARALAEDAKWALSGGRRRSVVQGRTLTFRFEVDGKVIGGAHALPENALYRVKI